MAQPIVVAILTACAVLFVSASLLLRTQSRTRDARLQHFIGQYHAGAVVFDDEPLTDWRSTAARRLNRYLARRDYVQATRLDLVRAGLQMRPTQFFLARMILALAGTLVGMMFLRGLGAVPQVIGMVCGFFAGYLVVKPFLDHRQRKRMDDFEKHLADGLDIMVGGLEAGSSITSAVELVSREMPAPLSTEFSRVLRDASLGMSYEEAFNGMYQRVPSDDVGMLVSAIGVQFRVGGNLAGVLRTLTDTVRDRQRIRGDVKTLTAQQKMTGWLITGIPIFMAGALLVLDRAYMSQIFQPGPQRYIALAGAVLLVVGNVIMRRILRIDV